MADRLIKIAEDVDQRASQEASPGFEQAYQAAADAIVATFCDDERFSADYPVGTKWMSHPFTHPAANTLAKVAILAALPYLNPAAPEPPEGPEEARRRAAEVWHEPECSWIARGRHCPGASARQIELAGKALDAAGLPSLLAERDRLGTYAIEIRGALADAERRANAVAAERDALRVRAEEAERALADGAAFTAKLSTFAQHRIGCGATTWLEADEPSVADVLQPEGVTRRVLVDWRALNRESPPKSEPKPCTCGLTALLDRIGATGDGGGTQE